MAKGQQRDPRKEAFWRGVVSRFRKNSVSVRAFCRREKVTEPAFYFWRRVIRERDAERPPVQHRRHRAHQGDRQRQQIPPAFVPVVLRNGSDGGLNRDSEQASAGIIVELHGGRVLRLPASIAAERLADLVRAVELVGRAMDLPSTSEVCS